MPHANPYAPDWDHRRRPTSQLAEAAAAVGLGFGFAWHNGRLSSYPKFSDIFLEQCSGGVATDQGYMLPTWVQPTQGNFVFTNPDAYYAVMQAYDMTARNWGHLVWHQNNPAWLEAITDPTLLRAALEAHITASVEHFPTIHHWNVVNEVIEPNDGEVNGYRDSFWYQVLGTDYIPWAFEAARAADPAGTLILNMDGVWASQADYREDTYNLLSRLVDDDVPVDGIGVQFHLKPLDEPDPQDIVDWLNACAALKPGFEVGITELDVRQGSYSAATRHEAVADYVREHVGAVCADVPALAYIICWEITDPLCWLRAGGRDPRADGLDYAGGTPFSGHGEPNPMAEALLDCFAMRPTT